MSHQEGGWAWGQGMSNRAVRAHDAGLCPASQVTGVPSKLVSEFCTPEEWHHTGRKKFANRTDFYAPDYVRAIFGLDPDRADEADPDAIAALAKYKADEKARRAKGPVQTYYGRVSFTWREWEQTYYGPYGKKGAVVPVDTDYTKMMLHIDGATWRMYRPDGRLFRKSRGQIKAYESIELGREIQAVSFKRKLAKRQEAQALRDAQTEENHRAMLAEREAEILRKEAQALRDAQDIPAEIRQQAVTAVRDGIVRDMTSKKCRSLVWHVGQQFGLPPHQRAFLAHVANRRLVELSAQ